MDSSGRVASAAVKGGRLPSAAADKRDSPRHPPAFEPLDPRLLAHPLDFLHAEHYRLRAVLTQLDGVARGAAGEAQRKLARALVCYFGDDYALHIADEDTGLFPLLRRRCTEDAAFLAGLETLAAEHRDDDKRVAAVIAGLSALAEGPPRSEAPAEFAAETRTFIEAQRRHIAWENAVLMPVARRCLGAADLRRLARKLAARRGVALAARARPPDAKGG